MGRLTSPVTGALYDDLVAGIGQPVQGAVAEDGVLEESQPFVHGPVAGDDEAGDPVAVEDQFIKVGRLLSREAVQAQVVQDEQVRRQEGPEGALDAVGRPGGVGGKLGGVILGISGAAALGLADVGLDQLAPVVDSQQLAAQPDLHLLTRRAQGRRHRVQGRTGMTRDGRDAP